MSVGLNIQITLWCLVSFSYFAFFSSIEMLILTLCAFIKFPMRLSQFSRDVYSNLIPDRSSVKRLFLDRWRHLVKTLHNHSCKPGINKHKKDSSKSLYGGTLSTTSKSHLRPRGRTMIEQVKESQKTQSFPLNSNWKIGGI
jgi:hypothetical protein